MLLFFFPLQDHQRSDHPKIHVRVVLVNQNIDIDKILPNFSCLRMLAPFHKELNLASYLLLFFYLKLIVFLLLLFEYQTQHFVF